MSVIEDLRTGRSGVDLSDDANRDVECTSVIVAPERACHRNSSLQMRSVDCINGTSALSAGALLGLRTYDVGALSEATPGCLPPVSPERRVR
jgi:hypothetical protein